MMFGLKIVVSANLPATWNFSKCRSPSRAKRRWERQRHQNPHMRMEPDKAVVIGNTAFVSPRMHKELVAAQALGLPTVEVKP